MAKATSWCALALAVLLMESKIPRTSATEDPHQGTCKDHRIVRGQKGMMVFSLSPEIDDSSDSFFLNLAQEGDSRDILRCHKKNQTSPLECEVNNSSFQFEGIVHNKLTVSIPNITLDFSGTYVLHVFVNETQGRPKTCTLTVVQELNLRKKGTISTVELVAIVLGVVSVIVIVAAIIICWYKRNRGLCIRNGEQTDNQQATGDTGDTGTALIDIEERGHCIRIGEQTDNQQATGDTGDTGTVLIDNEESGGGASSVELREHSSKTSNDRMSKVLMTKMNKDLKNKPWYHRTITATEANRLLMAPRYSDGTFLVMGNITKGGTSECVLKVKAYKEIKTYNIKHGEHGFWIEKVAFFETISKLITHYKGKCGCLPVKLVVPCMRG